MIYLDNAATTKPSKLYLDNYIYACEHNYFNASAPYEQGINSKKIIENCKKQICKMLGVEFNNNVVFTGSATEANNLAIFGSYKSNWQEVLVNETEHPSVYNSVYQLESKNVLVKNIQANHEGVCDLDSYKKSLTKNTNFISCMLVNNETGAINPIKEMVDIKNQICPKAIFHCDGVQAFGKLKINLLNLGVDLFSLSAHKIYGDKGLGALVCLKQNIIKPIIFGGGQELNLRSGTENICSIYAFNQVLADLKIENNFKKISELKNIFINELNKTNINYILNSNKTCSPYILSLTFPKVHGETLLHSCELENLIIGTGSACSSKKKGNRILQAMKISPDNIKSSVRVSFSIYNTEEEIVKAVKIISTCYRNLAQKLEGK